MVYVFMIRIRSKLERATVFVFFVVEINDSGLTPRSTGWEGGGGGGGAERRTPKPDLET